MARYLCLGLGQPVDVDIGQEEVHPLPGQAVGEGAAYAARGPGPLLPPLRSDLLLPQVKSEDDLAGKALGGLRDPFVLGARPG